MKSRSFAKILFLAVLSLICAFSLVLAACSAAQLPEETPEGEYTFENQETPRAETDENVTVDGAFDESFWATQRWYTYRYEVYEGYTVTVRMTSYFGEKGIYFAVETDDTNIHYNANKRITRNTGVELMFADGSVANAQDNAFRYSLSAGGMTGLYKYRSNTTTDYTEYYTDTASTPWSAVKLYGGSIASGECTGYGAEIFIPSGLFGTDPMPESLRVYIGYIVSMTSSAEEDYYYCALSQLHIGSGWSTCQSWYEFDETGFVCNDIEIAETQNGTVGSDYDYTLQGMAVPVRITPDSGYRIKSFTVDGEELSQELAVQDDGSCLYTLYGEGKDVSIAAEFEPIPDTGYTVSGSIAFDAATFEEGAPALSELYAGIGEIRLSAPGVVYAAEFSYSDAEGVTYTVTAPEGNYTLSVIAVKGYTMCSESIALDGNKSQNISVTENGWENIVYIDALQDAYATVNGAYGTFYSEQLSTDVFMLGGRLGVAFSEGTVVPEIMFTFASGATVRLQIMNWEGRYIVKLIVGAADYNVELQNDFPECMNAIRQNGGYVIASFEGETLRVYLENGSGAFTCVMQQTVAGLADTRLAKIDFRKADDQLNRTVSFTEGLLYLNDSDIQNYLAGIELSVSPAIDADEDAVKDLTGLNGVFRYGQTAEFSFVAAENSTVSVTLNGSVLTPEGTEPAAGGTKYTYSFKVGFANALVISVREPVSFGITFDIAPGFDDIAKVTALSSAGATYEMALSGGKYTAEVAPGNYSVRVESAGGYIYTFESVEVTAAADISLTLNAANWIADGYIENIPEQSTQESGWEFKTTVWPDNGSSVTTANFSFAARVAVGFADVSRVTAELRFDFANGKNVRVSFVQWDGAYYVRINNNEETKPGTADLAEAYSQMISSILINGYYEILVEFTDSALNIYLHTGTEYALLLTDTNVSTFSGSSLVSIKTKKSDDDGALTLTVSDGILGLNKSADELLARMFDEISIAAPVYDEEVITQFTGLGGIYAYGETVEFSFVAPADYMVTVTLNGEALEPSDTSSVSGGVLYAYTFKAKGENILVVNAKEPSLLSVTLNADAGLSPVAKVTAVGETTYELALSGSVYSVALPDGEYSVYAESADGYVRRLGAVTVEGNGDVSYSLTPENWNDGYIDNIPRQSTQESGSAFNTVLWQAGNDEKITAKEFTFMAKFELDFAAVASVSPELQFAFADGKVLRVQILKWAGTYYLKVNNNNASQSQSGSLAASYPGMVEKLENEKGCYLVIELDGTTVNAYLDNGSGEYVCVYTIGIDWLGSSELSAIRMKKNDDGGELTFTVTDTVIGLNKTAAEMLARKYDGQTVSVQNNAAGVVTDLTDLSGAYVYGENVIFSFTAPAEYVVSVTHNGKLLAAETQTVEGGIRYTYTFAADVENEIVVNAEGANMLGVTLTVTEGLSAVEKVTAVGMQTYELTLDGGIYGGAVMAGEYSVYAESVDGYVRKLGTVTVEGDEDVSYSLTPENWNDGHIALAEQTTTEGGSTFNLTVLSLSADEEISADTYTYYEKLSLDFNTKESLTTDLWFTFTDGSTLRVQFSKYTGGNNIPTYRINLRLNEAQGNAMNYGGELLTEIDGGAGIIESLLTDKAVYLAVEFQGDTVTCYLADLDGNKVTANTQSYSELASASVRSITAKKGSEDAGGSLVLTLSEISVDLGKDFDAVYAEKFPSAQ